MGLIMYDAALSSILFISKAVDFGAFINGSTRSNGIDHYTRIYLSQGYLYYVFDLHPQYMDTTSTSRKCSENIE